METESKQAAYFRLGLQLGIRSVDDAVEWADSRIKSLEQPSGSLIDLSLMAERNPLDVMAKLGELAGQVKPLDVIDTVLADAHAVLLEDPGFGRSLAKSLYHFCVESDYPDDYIECIALDDEYALADQGIGTAEDAYQRILEYTGSFREAAS